MWKGEYYFFLPDAAFLALDLALEAALLAAFFAFFPRRSDFISLIDLSIVFSKFFDRGEEK